MINKRVKSMEKTTGINMTIILVLFFLVTNVDGLKVSVTGAAGGSSSSFNQEFNLADDSSVDGKILIDGYSIHPDIKITEPSRKYKGLDYGEWNAEWWKWAFSMPIDKHPLFDTADASEGQEGNVWFIGSGFIGGDVDRSIIIPSGTRLFIPLFNYEASTIEGNGEGAELIANVESVMKDVKDLYAEIDGSSIVIDESFRAPSGLFEFGPLPDNNVLQFFGVDAPEGATSEAAADGYYMMLNPLPPGDHKIKWSSNWGDVFTQNVEYEVLVQPKGQYLK
jgi:hypothetical protein